MQVNFPRKKIVNLTTTGNSVDRSSVIYKDSCLVEAAHPQDVADVRSVTAVVHANIAFLLQ
jgi:hypothetical protein